EAYEKEAKLFVRETYKKAEALGTVETGPQVDDFTMFEQVYADPPPLLLEQEEMFKRELG
ncbi:MAG: 3-methyl-2-oxobutanoate dehydrogenase (2-methylpropanoyl-transferring) subunit alpha, partial [Pseudomonadota bacterium]